MVLSGALMLIEEGGPVAMPPGDIAVFPAGAPVGHCLRNDSGAPASFLVAASRDARDVCHYADLDLVCHLGGRLTRRDGTAAD